MICIENPNTGKEITFTPTSLSDTRKKIEQLKSNQTWALLTEKKRLSYLITFKKKLQKNIDHLQHILSIETGKPKWESYSEINAAINKLDATQMAYQYRCKYPSQTMNGKKVHTLMKPMGLISIIGPFNFPIHIPNGQILPALLTGNTVIVKSSEYTIQTTQAIEKLWAQTFNNIDTPIAFTYGDKKIGEELIKNSHTNAIFFTGSSKVGQQIEKECLKLRKPCALEMGGNNALIIDDASPQVLEHLTMSALITTGQRCTCARRILINKSHQHLIDEWIEHIKKLSIDTYPSDNHPFMGPVVLPQIKKQLLTKKFNQSDTILPPKDLGNGGLISPRIELTNKIIDNEIFGPIAFITTYESMDEAIQLANNSQYGLSCSIYTNSKPAFEHALKHIDCGIINWNTPTTGASGMAPFGGTKNSGNNKPGGFNMIDHCVIPTASNAQKKVPPLILPGGNA